MNFYINPIISNTFSIASERILVSLTFQHKKILAIAAVAFACLVAAFYLLRHLCIKDEHSIKPPSSPKIEKKDPPKSYQDYIALGKQLPLDGSVRFKDGTGITEWSQQGLFLRAIEMDPKNPIAYDLLGTTLVNNDTTTLLDGSRFTQEELFLQAIHLDPNYAPAYNNLGATLKVRSMQLPDGSILTGEQQMIKAKKQNINMDRLQANAIVLKDGTPISEVNLFLITIELDPNSSIAFYNLYLVAEDISRKEFLTAAFTFRDGTKMNRFDLLRKAHELNPQFAQAYCDLAKFAPNIEEHYIKAIHLDPTNPYPYYCLAYELFTKSTPPCTLKDGSVMNAEQLVRKAIELNPYAETYAKLLKEICEKRV